MSLLGALAVGSSLLGSVTNLFTNKKSTDTSVAMNRENNQFNAEQAQLNRDFQAEQSALQNAFNSEEAQKQRQWQEDMWNKQNDYNTPLAMLGRMQAAGLNPFTFNPELSSASSAGTGASATGSIPSGSQATSSSYSNPSMIPMGNIALETAQARLANAQAADLEEDTSLKQDTHDNKVVSSGIELQIMGEQVKMSEQQREEIKQRIEESSKRIEEINQNILQSQEYTRFLSLQGDQLQKELDHFEEKFAKEMRALDDQHLLTDAQIKEAWSVIRKNLAEANLAHQNARLANAQTGLVNAQTQGQFIQNALNGIEYKYQSDNAPAIAMYRLSNMAMDIEIKSAERDEVVSTSRLVQRKNKLHENVDINSYGDAMEVFDMFTTSLGHVLGGGASVTRVISKKQ